MLEFSIYLAEISSPKLASFPYSSAGLYVLSNSFGSNDEKLFFPISFFNKLSIVDLPLLPSPVNIKHTWSEFFLAWSTALSCLQGLDSSNVIRPFTPYVVMRMGNVPLVPYYRPGDKRIAQDLAELAADNQAFLLANHGPVVCGESLQEAANNMEELEETAKLIFILGDRPIRYLTAGEIAELRS